MELIDLVPEFNLYEEYWKIYTKSETLPPQYLSRDSVIEKSIVGEGSEIYGKVYNSVIGRGVVIGENAVIRDSIIMNEVEIKENAQCTKCIVAEGAVIGENSVLGEGEELPNEVNPKIYNSGLVTVGEKSIIPPNVHIGKNSVVFGETEAADYPDGYLKSGGTLIKAGDES